MLNSFIWFAFKFQNMCRGPTKMKTRQSTPKNREKFKLQWFLQKRGALFRASVASHHQWSVIHRQTWSEATPVFTFTWLRAKKTFKIDNKLNQMRLSLESTDYRWFYINSSAFSSCLSCLSSVIKENVCIPNYLSRCFDLHGLRWRRTQERC